MTKPNRFIYISGIIIFLLACNVGAGTNNEEQVAPTATLVVARFATPTETPPPTNTPPPEPTATATVTATSTSQAEPVTPTEESEEGDESATSEVATATLPAAETETPTVAPEPTEEEPVVEAAPPTATAEPTAAPLRGRIAFPVDDGAGHYDVWVIELPPDEPPFLVLSRARQPSFSADGRLLVKTQGGELGESIGLIGADYSWQGIINESPTDSYPFWNPAGTAYTFSNAHLLTDPETAHLASYIFTACSLQLPKFENDPKCQDTPTWGSIEVGEAPVWTDDDRLAFFTYKGNDGLYVVSNASVLREAGGLGAPQLLIHTNGRPSDTAGFQVFFSAGDLEQNWEAYVIDLDGTNMVNLSNLAYSQDGLPTVSPDGNWVAFVSDRDGLWGIWVKPLAGGEPMKIMDFSQINSNPSPWGTDDRAWMTERISWGP